MGELSKHERVSLAFQHRETDRIPVDFGGKLSGISVQSYNEMKQLLNFSKETEILDSRLQLAKVDEDILDLFSIDTRYIYQRPAISWNPRWQRDTYVDEWGTRLGRPSDGFYYDYIQFPLSQLSDVRDLEKHSWPDHRDGSRNNGVVEEASSIINRTHPFLINTFKGPFEQAWALRGFDTFLLDTLLNPELAEALLDKVVEVQKNLYGPFLEKLSSFIDMVCITDDLGGQIAPIISPKLYRELIMPRHKHLIDFIKSKTDGALVAIHSCGSVNHFIADFIEVGFDVLNPIQVTAKDMDMDFLKAEYGDKIGFWGAIDTQQLLNFAKPDEVRIVAEKTRRILGQGGGYLFSTSHNIQAKTPIENVVALFKHSAIL